MADGSKIEWTDATWQPITGCSIVSPGCTNCYAMKLAGGRLRNLPSRKGLTSDSKAGPVWNGEVRFNKDWLLQPLQWKKPRKIFVCAHGDLFHESVPDEWIDQVFAVMALSPQHTFQVLTKRAARMREYCLTLGRHHEVDRVSIAMKVIHEQHGIGANGAFYTMGTVGWHFENIWLGVSTERQQEADERIPLLLQTPAAVRFISAEPLLGPIDLNRIHEGFDTPEGARVDLWESCLTGKRYDMWAGDDEDPMQPGHPKLDWVIVGGESGANARPMHPAWPRSLRDQCEAAGVAFHFKQWGQFVPESCAARDHQGAHTSQTFGKSCVKQGGEIFWSVGKAKAGRLLDGVEHNGFPQVQA